MTKAECRIRYKKKRVALSVDEFVTGSSAICNILKAYDWTGITYLHTYVPIRAKKEPDVWPFVKWFQQTYPTKSVAIGRIDREGYTMQHIVFTEEIQLQANVWGILEPVAGKIMPEEVLDAVLIPLLACDIKGNRVGYGKGYYDRFLSHCRPDCKKIGVSLFEPIEKIEDVAALDVPLDMVITPKGKTEFIR